MNIDNYEISHIHDTVFSATGVSLDDSELRALVDRLPSNITDTAMEHSWADTVVRDKLYEFLESRS